MTGARTPAKNLLLLALLLALAAILVGLAARFLPPAIDWDTAFRPAGLAVWRGQSPYTNEMFRVAPWAILPVLPFAWLPAHIGRAAYFFASLLAYGFVAYRLGARPLTLAVFLLSPPVLHGLLNANNDWMPLLGFVLPPQAALFFLVIKPQVGLGLILFILVEAWRKGGWKECLRLFWPVTLATLASFAIFGFWPLRFFEPVSYWWNASLWPASIPVGLALMVAAIRKRRAEYAMAAAPCLSPYVLLHSWVGALAALARLPAEMLAAVIGLWILVLIRAFSGAG